MGRRGFTLLELIAVIAVLAILTALVLGAWSSVDQATRTRVTEVRIHTLGCKISERVGLLGHPPAALSVLGPALLKPEWMVDGAFLDGWGHPIEYVVTGNTFRLWSRGADGISGTGDDIEFSVK